MTNENLTAFTSQAWVVPVFLILMVWSLIWKGVALWRAAKDDSTLWFVLILILNTLGVLEIVYIFAISPMNKKLTAKTGSKTAAKM